MVKDLEEVITAVETCDNACFTHCAACPYYSDPKCEETLRNDILTYLKICKSEGIIRPGMRMIVKSGNFDAYGEWNPHLKPNCDGYSYR